MLFYDHTATLGGGEIALLHLVRHFDSAKIKPIVVLGANGPLVKQLQPEIETHVMPLPSGVGSSAKDKLGVGTLFRVGDVLKTVAYVWRLSRFIGAQKIDLVHTNSLKGDVIGGIAGRLARRAVVWHVRDRIDDDYLPRPVVRLFRFLCRVIPTVVIANSAATLRSIRGEGNGTSPSSPGGAQKKKMTVVHDGTLLATQSEHARNSDPVQIGLIGRISPWKGQHIFLRAAGVVHKRFPNARFVIVGAALFGEDEYDREVRNLPSLLGISEVVEFTGFRSDIAAVFANLDLVVHASTTGEPFGQVIIEGMAAGKAVVATKGGGVPEIVEDGATGILVPMGDVQAMAEAICRLLADPELARGMGKRGRKRVEDCFTVQLTARRVEAVYEEIFSAEVKI